MKQNHVALKHLLAFLHQTEGLKRLLRHSWLSNGRQESVAEHTWRMTLMAIVLSPYLEHPVNLGHALEMIIAHDLAEIYAGDHHAFEKPLKDKHVREKNGLEKLLRSVDGTTRTKITKLWNEYEQRNTSEAQFAKALDKLEVLIQHNEANLSTWDPREWEFNLVCADEYVAFSETLKEFRELLRDETKKKIDASRV